MNKKPGISRRSLGYQAVFLVFLRFCYLTLAVIVDFGTSFRLLKRDDLTDFADRSIIRKLTIRYLMKGVGLMNKPFCILFSRAYRAQTAQIRPRMADQGISMGQPKILHLLTRGSQTQVELARACDIEPATVSKILDLMEQAGMIERVRSDKDRRSIQVQITQFRRTAACQNERNSRGSRSAGPERFQRGGTRAVYRLHPADDG